MERCHTSAVHSHLRLPTAPLIDPAVALCLVMSIGIGAAVVQLPPLAFLIVLLPVGMLMATASASTWVALAVAVALGYRGLAGLHIAPGYGQFAHSSVGVGRSRGRPFTRASFASRS